MNLNPNPHIVHRHIVTLLNSYFSSPINNCISMSEVKRQVQSIFPIGMIDFDDNYYS